jgi:hypothetical protein
MCLQFVFNTATNTPGQRIPVGGGARMIAITPDGKTAYTVGWPLPTRLPSSPDRNAPPIRLSLTFRRPTPQPSANQRHDHVSASDSADLSTK